MSAKELEFLSNEAIEGESLADRLAKGGLPAQEALGYALDIGAALNRAHKKGAVHGKLSPHSILIASSGARIVRPVEGVDLDALAYRSPEQVAGEPPDARSDIFSFGTLLYEMVSGRRAFPGEGAALDRAIREDSPAPLMSKSPIHAAMEGVIAGCIQKDPGKRRQRVQNAVLELRLAARSLPRLAKSAEGPAVEFVNQPQTARRPGDDTDVRPNRSRIFTPVRFPDEIQAVPGRARKQRLFLWGLLPFALLLAAMGAWILWRMAHLPPQQVVKFPMVAPDNASYRMPTVSPDGRLVVVESDGPEGRPMLWLRPLDAMKPTLIPGTEGAFAPFWSPDSQYVGFFADSALKKVRLSDGHTEKICDTEPLGGGGAWNRSGTILFSPGQDSTLYAVSASGGQPRQVQQLNTARFERAHIWPQFLPDGRHFIFFVLSDSPSARGVYTGSLDSADYAMLFPSETNAVYSPPAPTDPRKHGYLLYIRNRSLVEVGFDASRLRVLTDPNLLADDVGAVASLSLAPISISNTAVLVYQSVSPASRQLLWVDRNGKTLAPVTEGGKWGALRIAPDGSRAIAARASEDQKSSDLWIVDRSGNVSQFTGGPGLKGSPVWSPDGSRIAYYSMVGDNFDLVTSPAANGSQADLLLKSADAKYPSDWSRDGRYLLFGVITEGTKSDIWGMTLADRHAGPILDTISSEGWATLSPDGKWLAYQSNESDRYQVYVQPFDGITRGTKRRYDVSTEMGGGMPHWRADGQELFYVTGSGRVMSVKVHPQGEEFQSGAPQPLFQTHVTPDTWNWFDVDAQGQKFLMNVPLEWPTSSPITVMTNWTEKIRD
ncbi:MAG TPA: protein kinase [Bryobacteraceae bacterium]|nr:protein kinase [Bryobacteraceae bacterium]